MLGPQGHYQIQRVTFLFTEPEKTCGYDLYRESYYGGGFIPLNHKVSTALQFRWAYQILSVTAPILYANMTTSHT